MKNSIYHTPQRVQVLQESRRGKPTGRGLNSLKAALAAANRDGKPPKMVI